QKALAQASVANNNNLAPDFLGGNALSAKPLDIGQTNALPIDFYTAGGAYPFAAASKRMRLHSGGELSLATYLAVNPLPALLGESQFNVRGRTNFLTGSGWHGAIKVENNGAIIFDNDQALPCGSPPCNNYYFIAHPSVNPQGDTYHGLIPDPDGNMNPQYIYKIYAKTRPGQALQGTHQFGTGAYLWPINNATGICAGPPNPNSGTLPPLRINVPPLYPTALPCQHNVWLDNFGLYQSEPFAGNTPLYPLGQYEGLVVADKNGVFNRKLTFSGISTDFLQGDGQWGQIGGTGFGVCPTPTILSNEIAMRFNEHSIYFEDPAAFPPATQRNEIGIGYNCSPALRAKFDVMSRTVTNPIGLPLPWDFTHLLAGSFTETGTYSPLIPPLVVIDFVGVRGESGVQDIPVAVTKRNNIGGDFYGNFTLATNIGARGTAVSTLGGNPPAYNIGLQGNAANANTNYGVHGIVDFGTYPPPPLSVNYAVYGDLVAPPLPCPPPCPNPIVSFAGYFNGDIGTTAGFWAPSDASLKQNIQNLQNPIEIISQLQPKSYEFNQQANQSMVFPEGIHYGLLSQDVFNVLPQLTKNCIHPARYDTSGNMVAPAVSYKALNYIELIPFLVAGMKQQQSQIDSLIEIIGNSQPQLLQQNPNDDNGNNGNSIDVTLSSKTVVLNQNKPNPFKEQTIIEYFISDDMNNVKIIFTDMKGDVLKEVDITEKGKGQLNVYASDLSSGVYSYTIVANGVTIDTKRMMKTK
ncbi:MAG: tail fiber domain-containing protein, partial [Bacteroidia bacterium]|nr:tail fiber domain-containing protein [Bacteroidia bacterium]